MCKTKIHQTISQAVLTDLILFKHYVNNIEP